VIDIDRTVTTRAGVQKCSSFLFEQPNQIIRADFVFSKLRVEVVVRCSIASFVAKGFITRIFKPGKDNICNVLLVCTIEITKLETTEEKNVLGTSILGLLTLNLNSRNQPSVNIGRGIGSQTLSGFENDFSGLLYELD